MAVVAVIVTLFVIFQVYVLLKAISKVNPELKDNAWFKWIKRISYCSPVILLIFLSIVLYFVKIIHLNFNSLNGWSPFLHSIFAIYLWINVTFNYFAAVITKPGRPPTREELFGDIDQNENNVKELSKSQELQFCPKCDRLQSYGSHHCRKCGECFRMVCHHSWIANNCIGLVNFAYYFQFLVFGFIGLLYSLCMTYGPFHACYVHDHNHQDKIELEYPAMSQQICRDIGELPLIFVIVLVATILHGGLLSLHCCLLAADLSFISFITHLKESKSFSVAVKAIFLKSFRKQRRMKYNMLLKERKKSWKQFFYPSFNVLPIDLSFDDVFDQEEHFVQMV